MLYIVNNSIHDCKHICASSMPSVPSKKTIIYNLLQNLNSHVLTDKSMTDPIFIKQDVFVLWCQKINNSIITLRCVMNLVPMNMIRQWASDFNSFDFFFFGYGGYMFLLWPWFNLENHQIKNIKQLLWTLDWDRRNKWNQSDFFDRKAANVIPEAWCSYFHP